MIRHAKAPSRHFALHGGVSAGAAARRGRGYFGLICLCVLGLAAFLGSSAPAVSAAEACPNEEIRAREDATFLPECRGYEMVSPVDKNGGEVSGDPSHVIPATSGNATAFSSLQYFGDVRGGGISTEYASVRGAAGWSTHAISPQVQPISAFEVLGDPTFYTSAFTPDLSAGILVANSPLTEAPNVKLVHNLYRRDDVLSPGPGTYELLTDSVNTLPHEEIRPAVTGASTDLGKVIFESRLNLTANASGESDKLYEWDHGTVRLAGILPNGEPAGPGCEEGSTVCSAAGSPARGGALYTAYTPHTISSDGSRVFFTSPVSVYGEDTGESSLYMRDDHGTASTADDVTTKLNVADPGAPADTPSPADYLDAISDGSKAYFKTVQALTPDAPVNNSWKLYAWSAAPLNASGNPDPGASHLRLITVLANEGEQLESGVIGTSTNGAYVYFTTAGGQLVAGGPEVPVHEYGIYLWHDDGTASGTLAYLGYVDNISAGLMDGVTERHLGRDSGRVTPDGLHMSFMAYDGTGLAPHYDHGTTCGPFHNQSCLEVYVYDATANGGAGKLACASCNPGAEVATSDAGYNFRTGTSLAASTDSLNNALSADGSHVFFTTGEALVPQDTNGARDVYEYDIEDGSLHLISTGESSQPSYFMNATPSGSDVYFITREQLVGQDSDPLYDLYDARVDGGLASQSPPPPPAPCAQADTCRSVPPAPQGASAASASFSGPGNPKHHRRRHRRRHHRRRHLHRRAARTANTDLGGTR